MTEYDYSPEAYDRFMAQQDRIGRWVDKTQNHAHEFFSPFEFTRSEADREQSTPPSPFDRHTPPPGPYHAPFSPPAQGPAITYATFGQPYAAMPQNAGATYFAPVPGASYLPPTQHAAMNRSRSHDGHSRSLDSTHKQHGQKRSQSRGNHARSPTYIIQPPAGPSSYPSFASQPVVSPPIGHGSVFYYPAASQPQSRVTSPGVNVQNVYTYQGRSYSVQSPPGSVYSMQSPPASLYGPQSPPASYGTPSPQGTYMPPQQLQQQQAQPYPVWYAPQMQQMPNPPQYLVIPKTKTSKRSKSKQSSSRVIYV